MSNVSVKKSSEFMLKEICESPKWKIIGEGSVGGRKTLEAEGLFQFANKKNQNGRMYPAGILAREIKKLQGAIKNRNLFGELDHPEILETSLQNASHIITKLWMEGNAVMGRLEVLSTPSGNTLRNLYEDRTMPGISSRGAGRVIERDNYYEIAPDFELTTFDIVANPSTHNAFPKMLSESQIIRLKEEKNKKQFSIREWEQQYLAGGILW